MAKKTKKVKEELGSLEDIDTTSLNLKQLQDFCLRVHKEIGKVEEQSRELEIERNKLKTMLEIAEEQAKEAKSSQRRVDELLDEEKETFITDMWKMLNSMRNVLKESLETSSDQLLVTSQAMKTLTEAYAEGIHEIENDITFLLNLISQHDKFSKDNFTELKMECDKEISRTIEGFYRNYKQFMTHFKKMSKEIIKNMTDESVKKQENFNDYKNKKIQDYLKENNKKITDYRHHCEKIQHHNTLILDNLHENYKAIKSDVKYLESSVKSKKLNFDQMAREIIENTEKNHNMVQKLGNSKKTKYNVKNMKRQRVTHQKKLDDLKLDQMFLDEILTLRERTEVRRTKIEEEEFLKLQLEVMKWLVELENIAVSVSAKVRTIDQVIDMAKMKDSYLGQELTTQQVKELVLADLEEDADEEVMKDVRVSIARTSLSLSKVKEVSWEEIKNDIK